MNIERNAATESIDYIIIYIEAMLQWVKISIATLLSTFYCYFASDDRKCINYCSHCRKLKCIHYYSFNFRQNTFYHKSDSICKTIPTYCPCRYKYWYTSSIFLHSNTATKFLGVQLLGNSLYRVYSCKFVYIVQHWIKYLNLVYLHISWFENKYIT